jgi:RNA polymerase sigma factor (sigma-70 family)
MKRADFIKEALGLEPDLISRAYSLTNDLETAKDLVQDTYLKALININKARSVRETRAWLFTILRNTFINYYNKREHIRIELLEDMSMHNEMSDLPSPDSKLIEQDILKTINTLPFVYRRTAQLTIKGFGGKEICKLQNISPATYKIRIKLTEKALIKYM